MSGKGTAGTTSTLVPRTAGNRSASNAPTGAVGLRRRSATTRSGGSSSKMQQSMNFYTDDSPGVKISPVYVIGMSLFFILAVTILHVVGKIRGA